ncbi:hypothetical protein CRX72_06915 [Pantoea sp. BRM17]|nr:hypothetical protein CRX72_06915 [Pantoea sp. BRM17]
MPLLAGWLFRRLAQHLLMRDILQDLLKAAQTLVDRHQLDQRRPGGDQILEGGESLTAAAQAAAQGAEATAQMNSAKAGRSAYLNQQSLDGVKDPGAYAVEKVFQVMAG